MTAMRFFPDTDEVAVRCPLYGFVTKYTPSLVRQQLDNLQVSRAAKTELCLQFMHRARWPVFNVSCSEASLLNQPEAVRMAEELQHQVTEHSSFKRIILTPQPPFQLPLGSYPVAETCSKWLG